MLRSMLFWSSVVVLGCVAHVTFTNLKCSFKNKTIGVYEQCHIKAVNRTRKYVYIYGKLYVKPIDNVTVKFKLMRHDHGYKPFFIDMSFDFCKFMKNKQNPIVNIFYNPFKNASNINHTCPYNHDIIVDKFYTGDHDVGLAKHLPIPNGDYALHITMFVSQIECCTVILYMRVTN